MNWAGKNFAEIVLNDKIYLYVEWNNFSVGKEKKVNKLDYINLIFHAKNSTKRVKNNLQIG